MGTLDIALPVSGFLLGYLFGRLHRMRKRSRIVFIVEHDDESNTP